MKSFKEFLKEDNCLFEMAQKQGVVNKFTFYTFDNEYESHYPHVHICVKIDDKNFEGKPLKNKSNLKTIGSIRINLDDNYDLNNLVFENVFDEKNMMNIQNQKIFIDWLNKPVLKNIPNYTNANKCLIDYDISNEKYKDKLKYTKKINQIKGE